MAIDPRTGFQTTPTRADDLPRPSPDQPIPDETLDLPANDGLGMARVEERRPTFWFPLALLILPTFWFPLALLILMLAGAGYYYFFGPHNGPTVRADSSAVTKSKPRPN